MIQQEFNQIIQAQQFYKMSSTSFRGIYLGEDDKLSIREIDQVYQPTGSQSLVQVKYSAINPADKKHYQMGMHSFIAGYEWIGTVKAIGPDSPYKVGEALFGLAMFGHKRPLSRGAHQDYLLAETWGTARVPKSMLGEGLGEEERDALWRQAVAWPVGARTAIDMLFNELDFAFPGVPGLEQGADPRGRAILIWGGASVVGLSAIQLAKAAGFSPIYATASAKNHKAVLDVGATHVFDYTSSTVVEEIRAAVKASGKELSVVADAVATGVKMGTPPSAPPHDITKASPTLAKQSVTEGAKDVRLVASLVVEFDPAWKFCLAMRDAQQQPVQHARMEAAAAWLWENHEGKFRMPNIRVVKGIDEGIAAIETVVAGKVSMEKLVIEHPL
jgi:NADPH:quinone reductase-like Zn-dependent oxidoreductase